MWKSAVSVWEIALKHALRRCRPGELSMSTGQTLGLFLDAGHSLLGVSSEHAVALESLPPLHGDPFDRLLVAQALTQPPRLITHDAKFAAYGDTIVYFRL